MSTENCPPLPHHVFDVASGRVKVWFHTPLIHADGDVCEGMWDEIKRTIEIDAAAAPERQWFAFFHEMVEMRLSDSGLDYVIPDKLRDAICSALATAEMAELRRSLKPSKTQK